jgi:ABC-2 type transport system ATP-binding protein
VTTPSSPATATPTVRVDEVSRFYGDVVALHRVSFELRPGITGLLGPNGAGKTSVIRVLTGLHPADEGRVEVLGRDPRRRHDVHRDLGYVPESAAMPERVSARRLVRVLAGARGVEDADGAAASALAAAGLDPDDPRPIATYSKGMRQRAKLAAALAHDPNVLVLDEPLNGLDPQGRLEVMDLLRRLGDRGVTVLVSSHVLHEVQRLAPRVLVMVQGRLAAEGSPRAIRDLMDDRPARLRVVTDGPRALAAALARDPAVAAVEVAGGDTLLVAASDAVGFRDRIAAAAVSADVLLREVRPLDDDLDSVFAYLVQRGIR